MRLDSISFVTALAAQVVLQEVEVKLKVKCTSCESVVLVKS